jgi:hypothetical protein
VFLVVFPHRLTLPSTSRVSSASHFLVVCSPSVCVCLSFPPTTHPTPPPPISPNPNVFTRARHEPSHRKPCQTPNLSFPSHPPSPTFHVPIWCPGNWPSTGQHAAYSPNETPSGSCSPSATTLSGLSSTLPLGGRLGRDQTSRSPLLLPSALTLLPGTLTNAPRKAGQRCWHVQLLSLLTIFDI